MGASRWTDPTGSQRVGSPIDDPGTEQGGEREGQEGQMQHTWFVENITCGYSPLLLYRRHMHLPVTNVGYVLCYLTEWMIKDLGHENHQSSLPLP